MATSLTGRGSSLFHNLEGRTQDKNIMFYLRLSVRKRSALTTAPLQTGQKGTKPEHRSRIHSCLLPVGQYHPFARLDVAVVENGTLPVSLGLRLQK